MKIALLTARGRWHHREPTQAPAHCQLSRLGRVDACCRLPWEFGWLPSISRAWRFC